jgi:hypothetical protein
MWMGLQLVTEISLIYHLLFCDMSYMKLYNAHVLLCSKYESSNCYMFSYAGVSTPNRFLGIVHVNISAFGLE